MKRNKRGSSQASNPSTVLRTLRIALVGADNVGKSAIAKQFVYNEFDPEEELSIVEVYHKQVVFNGQPLILEILDTGQEFSNPMMDQNFIGFDGYLLVFSLWDMDSLNAVSDLRARIRQMRTEIDSYDDSFDIPMILVGNKKDLLDDGRIANDVLDSAKTFAMPLIMTSAWTGDGITDAFKCIVDEIDAKNTNAAIKERKHSTVKKSRFNKCNIT